MSQYSFGNLSSPVSGATLIDTHLEPWRDALHSCHSGSSRPSYAVAGTVWLDTTTTPWVIKIFDGTDDISIGTVNATSNVFNATSATPADASVTAAKLATTVVSGLSAETAVDTADELLLSDTSAGTADKCTVNNLFKAVNTFTAETSVDTADVLPLYDASAGTADKCTVGELFKAINTLTQDTAPDAGADYVVTYDASGTAAKKVLLSTAISQVAQNSQSAAYTTVLADAGKHIFHPSADTTARTFTIDSNANVAYPIGTAITFINENGAGTVTISITSDTMRLAGAGTTGSRTLAANGVATAIKVTSTSWIISGTGLT